MFNTECETAPLLDAINEGCYADMTVFLKKREEVFNKELNQWKKKEASLLKKLEKLEPKQDEAKMLAERKSKSRAKSKKKAKKKKEESKAEETKEGGEEAKEEGKPESK